MTRNEQSTQRRTLYEVFPIRTMGGNLVVRIVREGVRVGQLEAIRLDSGTGWNVSLDVGVPAGEMRDLSKLIKDLAGMMERLGVGEG